jgi:hypothetical protein
MTLALTLLLALAASPAPPPSPAASPAPKASPAPAERRPGQPVNIRLDIKLTERRGEGAPVVKVVSMAVADRRNGMIRASNGSQPSGDAFRPAALNVDASPVIEDGRIVLSLGLEYNINDASPEARSMPLRAIREQFWVVLESGRPMVVSDSADPSGDRRLQVEVTGTILR